MRQPQTHLTCGENADKIDSSQKLKSMNIDFYATVTMLSSISGLLGISSLKLLNQSKVEAQDQKLKLYLDPLIILQF